MFRNYLTVGIRALLKNRAYAAINIVGLAIGLAACLMILLYVRYETSWDSWVPDAARTYQFQSSYRDTGSGTSQPSQMAPYPASAALRKDFPEIEKTAYVMNTGAAVLKGDTPIGTNAVDVEPDFFDIYPVPFIHGSGADALRDPNSVAISKSFAEKIFGTDDVVGKTLVTIGRKGRHDRRVAGVFADLPKNSHQDFDVVRRFVPTNFTGDAAEILTNWGDLDGWVYLKLRPGSDPRAMEARFPAWSKRNVPTNNLAGEVKAQNDGFTYRLVKLTDIHLSRAGDGSPRPTNDPGTIAAFAGVALLVLGMACVNFTNLTTARSTQRAREVALRKVLGASRRQLIVQYLTEAVLVALIALLLALALVELGLPWLNQFLDAGMTLHYFGDDGALLPVLGLTLLVGLAGGAYPAIRLSGFQPARVLKANRSTDAEGSGMLRSALVVGQFAVSIALIICTIVIHAQTVYATHVDPGFNRNGLLQLDDVNDPAIQPNIRAFENEIRALPGVVAVTRTRIGVNTGTRSNNLVTMPGQSKAFPLGQYPVEANFFDVMGIKLLAGRELNEANGLDDGSLPESATDAQQQAFVARGLNVVVNRAAAKRMGFRDPQAAIGKQFNFNAVDSKNGLVPTTIVGVVEDTRYRSVREAVEPIIYFLDDPHLTWMDIRYATSDPIGLRSRVETVWKKFAPQLPYQARFADEIVARQYRNDRARAEIFAAFALLSVIVGCLGLFGLAAFTAERRTKEIGIRKVLGARTRDIVQLLVWQFCRPVILANILAWPVAWWLMRGWLERFDTRVTLTPLPFVAAGGLALLIAVATIAGHAAGVARANPIKALRYE